MHHLDDFEASDDEEIDGTTYFEEDSDEEDSCSDAEQPDGEIAYMAFTEPRAVPTKQGWFRRSKPSAKAKA